MLHPLLVGIGGFLGSISRYLVSGLVQRLIPAASFPLGTLAVNVVGCLVIGLAAGAAEHRHSLDETTRALFFIGFLGGFTTFSTFGYETYALARNSDMLGAAANITLHVVAGLGAVWLGFSLARP